MTSWQDLVLERMEQKVLENGCVCGCVCMHTRTCLLAWERVCTQYKKLAFLLRHLWATEEETEENGGLIFCLCVFVSLSKTQTRGNVRVEGIASIRLASRQEILLIDDWCGGFTYLGQYHPQAGGPGLYKKQAEQTPGNRTVNSVPTGPLLQLLLPVTALSSLSGLWTWDV